MTVQCTLHMICCARLYFLNYCFTLVASVIMTLDIHITKSNIVNERCHFVTNIKKNENLVKLLASI